MRLENIRVMLRPRAPAEAIDLGFSLLRHWWQPFYRVWLGVVLPWIVLAYGVAAYSPALAAFLVWWLKPAYDRVILHFFSHALFGETPTVKSTWRALPHLLWHSRLFAGLLWWRLSMARSFLLPVWQLEGLRGKKARERSKILSRQALNNIHALIVLCSWFEWLVYITFFGLIFMLLPEGYEFDVSPLFEMEAEPEWGLIALAGLANMAALSIVEPLYVAAGFTLYLNRRTHLEGWDIELAFRRLAARLQAGALAGIMAGVILVGGLSLAPDAAWADAPDPAQAKEYIREILQAPEFQEYTQEYQWRRLNAEPEADFDWLLNTDASWVESVARLFEIILWGAAIAGVAWLVAVLARRLDLRRDWAVDDYQAAPFLLGNAEEEAPLDLSADLPERAWQLWQAGQPRQALSLLYRGALAVLERRDGLALRLSATESECLRTVRQRTAAELSAYFTRLTGAWLRLAYAHRAPPDTEMRLLCQDWRQFFNPAPGAAK